MATFQKPENALKRAEELIEVDKKQDALDTLHAAILHRKFRNLWTSTIEQIMIKHLELCVELKKTRIAREGLHQYRTTCQAANIGSLEHVVQKLRSAAENKVNEARNKAESGRMAELEDLDEMEAPQTILLRAIQAQDTRQQSQDRDVHMHFRFLWDTYKVILDVLKSNARLEEVYHETARHAFDFCRQNKRPQEFKRLCETLRKNYLELQKRTGATPAHQVNPNSLDTVTRTLETRCRQLQIATELDLWREAYGTATEIFELMNKARPKPHLRSMYYESLGQIFWKGENYLFHAFACLKNLVFVKALKNNLSEDERKLLASRAVLATLCVPFQNNSDLHATLELTTESSSSSYEKAKKHSHLFNAQSVPTRDTIIAQLAEKNLLSLASMPCVKLFDLIESDFTPLSLCQDAKPYLDELAKGDACDGKLAHYVTPLKQIIFFRLVKQLSEVYANMTIENFERAASIVPFEIAEKWLAQAAKAQGINVQINYREKAIIFGASRKVDMKSMKQPLIEIGYKLQQAMYRIAPEEQLKKEKTEKKELSQNIQERIEEESRQIRARKEEIERRKEESERKKEQQEREAHEKAKKQEQREAELERQRQEEERKRREQEREEQRRKDMELKKTEEMLAQMKKQAEQHRNATVKVGGKKIDQIGAADLSNFTLDQIEKAKEAQELKERQDRIRQRKLESKRVDHLARAFREEERKRIDTWAEQIEAEDQTFMDKALERQTAEQKSKHQEDLKEKEAFEAFLDSRQVWLDEKLEERSDTWEQEEAKRIARAMDKAVDLKMQRAKQRKAEFDEYQAQEAQELRRQEAEQERQAREEEAKRREEEERLEREERLQAEREEEEARMTERKVVEEQKRKEREEERRKAVEAADRAEAKRREREREIEERQSQQADTWRRGGGDGDRPSFANRGGREPREPREPREARGAREEPQEESWMAERKAAAERAEARRKEREREIEERPKPSDQDSWRRGGGDNDRPSFANRGTREAREPRETREPRGEPRGEPREAREPRETRAPRAAAPAPTPAPAPAAAAEEDDGFETVVKKKKGGKTREADGGAAAAQPASGGGDEARLPPWKKRDAPGRG